MSSVRCTASSILLLLALASVATSAQGVVDLQVEGAVPGAFFGFAVAGHGDVNGDGLDDFSVGAPIANSVFVYSGLTGALIRQVSGENAGDEFGGAVARAGDVDGDGVEDIVVGAQYHGANGASSGKVYLVSGADGSTIAAVVGENTGDRLGEAVASLGDVTGDGRPDILAAAPFHLGVGLDSGRVYVLDGVGLATVYTLDGAAASDLFGYSVSGVPDVDADGWPDILVVVRWSNAVSANAGRVSMFSGQTGAFLYHIDGEGGGDQFGVSVGAVSDIDGDGAGDLIVGAMQNDHGGQANVGRAYAFSGATGAQLFVWTGEAPQDRLGSAVAGAGDTNGDGIDDFVVASAVHSSVNSLAGRVYVMSGVDGSQLAQWDGAAAGDLLGTSVGGGLDTNGDGFAEVLMGAIGHDNAVIDAGVGLACSLPSIPVGPFVGPCGAGGVSTTSGAAQDVLLINGTAGSPGLRRVDLPLGADWTIDLLQPAANQFPAPWIIFGHVGPVSPLNQISLFPGTALPYTFCFAPAALFPTDLSAFTLAASVGGGALIQAPLGPWNATFPGAQLPFSLAFQGIIAQDPLTYRITNAVVLRFL